MIQSNNLGVEMGELRFLDRCPEFGLATHVFKANVEPAARRRRAPAAAPTGVAAAAWIAMAGACAHARARTRRRTAVRALVCNVNLLQLAKFKF